jgi:hypothetical protein
MVQRMVFTWWQGIIRSSVVQGMVWWSGLEWFLGGGWFFGMSSQLQPQSNTLTATFSSLLSLLDCDFALLPSYSSFLLFLLTLPSSSSFACLPYLSRLLLLAHDYLAILYLPYLLMPTSLSHACVAIYACLAILRLPCQLTPTSHSMALHYHIPTCSLPLTLQRSTALRTTALSLRIKRIPSTALPCTCGHCEKLSKGKEAQISRFCRRLAMRITNIHSFKEEHLQDLLTSAAYSRMLMRNVAATLHTLPPTSFRYLRALHRLHPRTSLRAPLNSSLSLCRCLPTLQLLDHPSANLLALLGLHRVMMTHFPRSHFTLALGYLIPISNQSLARPMPFIL